MADPVKIRKYYYYYYYYCILLFRILYNLLSSDNVVFYCIVPMQVSATYADGFRCTAVCALVGPKSDEKAMKTAESILKRTRRMFKALGMDDFTDVNLQVCTW